MRRTITFFQKVLDQNPCKQSNLKSILNFDWLQAVLLKEVQYALSSQIKFSFSEKATYFCGHLRKAELYQGCDVTKKLDLFSMH